MAYGFSRSSTTWIDGPISFQAEPLTIAARVYRNPQGGGQGYVTLYNDGVETGHGMDLTLRATSLRDGSTTRLATSTAGMSDNVWYHGAARFASSNSRSILLDGGNLGTNANNQDVNTFDRLRIGRSYNGTTQYLNGSVCEVAIWSAELTTDEVISLSKGFKAYRIRPQSLLYYVPLVRNVQELRSAIALDARSSTVENHPRVY